MADNKDKKVLNVPALRFPEFIKSWEHLQQKEFLKKKHIKIMQKILRQTQF